MREMMGTFKKEMLRGSMEMFKRNEKSQGWVQISEHSSCLGVGTCLAVDS